MDVHTSNTPHIEVAHALSEALEKHKNTPVLLLLAGGSALTVLDHLAIDHINEYTTIMMMDERFSASPAENNFRQMTQTFFYTKLSDRQCNFIPSVPEAEETHEDFSMRMEHALSTYLTEHPTCTVIALFGIGSDGHTGAIFPMGQTDFVDTYGQGNIYTKVIYDKNPFAQRASITPKFIKKYITGPFVYAVGEAKRPILSTITDPYELHEMPAHIHTIIGSTLYTDQEL